MTDNDVNKQLLNAARKGHTDTVRDLIQKQGADPDVTNKSSMTPIFVAARFGHVEVVRALGELGADPNLADIYGARPIFVAAEYGHVEVVRALGELGADPNLVRTDDGETPIFMAAWNGHAEVVRVLLELGADETQLNQERRRRLLGAWVVPQQNREQIRAELDDKIEEVQIIELVADFVGPMCDPKRRKAYIVECAQHRAEMKRKRN
jgi:ankyrin repeat protein